MCVCGGGGVHVSACVSVCLFVCLCVCILLQLCVVSSLSVANSNHTSLVDTVSQRPIRV